VRSQRSRRVAGRGDRSAALNFIRTRIARGTEVYADEASAWNELHGRFTMHRINQQEAYSLEGGIYTNNAESFFSRMRRAEIGHHHHLAGPYLARFAQESASFKPGGARATKRRSPRR
jgi:hypothetical protein